MILVRRVVLHLELGEKIVFAVTANSRFRLSLAPPPPSQQKSIPIFVLVFSRAGRMIAHGSVIVAACLTLLGLVVESFATVSRPHAVAVRGAESAWDPFAFDRRHQLVDAEIGLGAFVG